MGARNMGGINSPDMKLIPQLEDRVKTTDTVINNDFSGKGKQHLFREGLTDLNYPTQHAVVITENKRHKSNTEKEPFIRPSRDMETSTEVMGFTTSNGSKNGNMAGPGPQAHQGL